MRQTPDIDIDTIEQPANCVRCHARNFVTESNPDEIPIRQIRLPDGVSNVANLALCDSCISQLTDRLRRFVAGEF